MAADMANTGRHVLLGVLIVIAVALVGYQAWPRTSTVPAGSTEGGTMGARTERAATPAATAPAVHLHALEAGRPKPLSLDRNLFRFRPKPAPPPPPAVRPVVATPAPSAPAEPPPPRLPPITYRFIGIVEAPDQAQRIAVLSDGQRVLRGREGDLIEGRYRILRIGADTIEMAYADGRGRQTIRLTGS